MRVLEKRLRRLEIGLLSPPETAENEGHDPRTRRVDTATDMTNNAVVCAAPDGWRRPRGDAPNRTKRAANGSSGKDALAAQWATT